MTYVIFDGQSGDAVVMDPVLDYEPASATVSDQSLARVADFIRRKKLNLHVILETHAHADHLSGGQELKKHFPRAQVAIGVQIQAVQKAFKEIFYLDKDFPTDGSQFDRLFDDGEDICAGALTLTAIHTPGHTPACYSFQLEDALFTGDALFMPDFGVARCDFPGGSAETLFESITQKIYSLPDDTKFFTGHDYQPGGRELQYQSTIGESKRSNIHLNANTTKEEFVAFRSQRDSTLSPPQLLLPGIQINIQGGHIPSPEANGVSYLKIPLTVTTNRT